MGHRIAKHVYNSSNQLEKSTYYVLDAQEEKALSFRRRSTTSVSATVERYAMSVYEREVNNQAQQVIFQLTENYIYGSSRVGVKNSSVNLLSTSLGKPTLTYTTHEIGKKTFELTNHLGNVLSTISDKLIPHTNGTAVDYFLADIRTASDYYPPDSYRDGSSMRERDFALVGAEEFRFGFQGQEHDDEVKGDGNSYTTEFRQYDPRLGRWMSIDPKFSEFPWQSPYVAFDNKPTIMKDPKGLAAEGGGNGDKLHQNADGTRSENNADGTKTYDAPGFSTITIPKRAKILGSVQDSNHNGKLDDGHGNTLEASKGDLYKFSIDGVIYTAQFSSGKFMGYENSKGEGYSGIKKSATPASSNSTLSNAWNSPLARALVPDKLIISFSSSVTAFVGVTTDLSFNWITRCNDAQLTPYVLISGGGQAGPQVSADALINVSGGYYFSTDLRSEKPGVVKNGLRGWTVSGSIDAGDVVGGSIFTSVGFSDNPLVSRPTFFSAGIGGGASIGGGGTVGASYSWPVFPSQF